MRVRYIGPDAVCRTHFGAHPKGEPFEMDAEEAAFVAKHLPGQFEPVVEGGASQAAPADFTARTKPATTRKKG